MKRMINKVLLPLGLLVLMPASVLAVDSKLQWARTTTLSTSVSGTVTELKVQAGQRVNKGEVLLRISPRLYTSRLKAAESMYQRFTDASKEARAELDRMQEMYDNSMLSDHQLEVVRIAYVQAESEHKKAVELLASARMQLQQSSIRAPFDAIVIHTQVALHETVNGLHKAVPLVSLISNKHMSVHAPVSWSQAMELSPGKRISVEFAGRTYHGVINKIVLDQESAKAGLEVELPIAPAKNIYPGLSASIKLP